MVWPLIQRPGAGQERDHLGDVGGRAQPLQRIYLGQSFDGLFLPSNCVDGDVPATQLLGQDQADRVDRGLAGRFVAP
jgi:hypothetical protein